MDLTDSASPDSPEKKKSSFWNWSLAAKTKVNTTEGKSKSKSSSISLKAGNSNSDSSSGKNSKKTNFQFLPESGIELASEPVVAVVNAVGSSDSPNDSDNSPNQDDRSLTGSKYFADDASNNTVLEAPFKPPLSQFSTATPLPISTGGSSMTSSAGAGAGAGAGKPHKYARHSFISFHPLPQESESHTEIDGDNANDGQKTSGGLMSKKIQHQNKATVQTPPDKGNFNISLNSSLSHSFSAPAAVAPVKNPALAPNPPGAPIFVGKLYPAKFLNQVATPSVPAPAPALGGVSEGNIQRQLHPLSSSYATPLSRILGNAHTFKIPFSSTSSGHAIHIPASAPISIPNENRFPTSPASIGRLFHSLTPTIPPVKVKLKKLESVPAKRMSFSDSYFSISTPPSKPKPANVTDNGSGSLPTLPPLFFIPPMAGATRTCSTTTATTTTTTPAPVATKLNKHHIILDNNFSTEKIQCTKLPILDTPENEQLEPVPEPELLEQHTPLKPAAIAPQDLESAEYRFSTPSAASFDFDIDDGDETLTAFQTPLLSDSINEAQPDPKMVNSAFKTDTPKTVFPVLTPGRSRAHRQRQQQNSNLESIVSQMKEEKSSSSSFSSKANSKLIIPGDPSSSLEKQIPDTQLEVSKSDQSLKSESESETESNERTQIASAPDAKPHPNLQFSLHLDYASERTYPDPVSTPMCLDHEFKGTNTVEVETVKTSVCILGHSTSTAGDTSCEVTQTHVHPERNQDEDDESQVDESDYDFDEDCTSTEDCTSDSDEEFERVPPPVRDSKLFSKSKLATIMDQPNDDDDSDSDNTDPMRMQTIICRILIHIVSSKELLRCRLVSRQWKAVASKILELQNTLCIKVQGEDDHVVDDDADLTLCSNNAVVNTSTPSFYFAENKTRPRPKYSTKLSAINAALGQQSISTNFCRRYIFENMKLEHPETQNFFKLQGPHITHLSLSLRPTEDFHVFIDLLYNRLGNLVVLEILQSPKSWHWPNTNLPTTLPKLKTIIFPQNYQEQNQHGPKYDKQQGLPSFTGQSSPWLIQQILGAAINLENVFNFPVGLLPVFQYAHKMSTIKSTTLYFTKTNKPHKPEERRRSSRNSGSSGKEKDSKVLQSPSPADPSQQRRSPSLGLECEFGFDFEFIGNYTAMANQKLELSHFNNTFMSNIIISSSPAIRSQIAQIVSKILHSSQHSLVKFETEPFGFLCKTSTTKNDKMYLPVFEKLDEIHFRMPPSSGTLPLSHSNGQDTSNSFLPYGVDPRSSFQSVTDVVFNLAASCFICNSSTPSPSSASSSRDGPQNFYFLILNLRKYFPALVFTKESFFSASNFKFVFGDSLSEANDTSCFPEPEPAVPLKPGRDKDKELKIRNNEKAQLKKFPSEFRRFLSIFANVKTCEVTLIPMGVLGSFLRTLFLSAEAWPGLEKLVVSIKEKDPNNYYGNGNNGKDKSDDSESEGFAQFQSEFQYDYPFLDEIITGLPELRCRWLRMNEARVKPSLVEGLRSKASILNLKSLKTFNIIFETRDVYKRHMQDYPIISIVSSVYGFLLMEQKLEGDFYCLRN